MKKLKNSIFYITQIIKKKTFDLIVYPGIDSIDGIEMSDFNAYLSNTLGENITIRLGKERQTRIVSENARR